MENKGEHDKAIADCDEAVRLDPNEAWIDVGRAAMWGRGGIRQGRCRLRPRDLARSEDRVRLPGPRLCMVRQARYDKGIADFDEAIRLDPQDPAPLYYRGAAGGGSGNGTKRSPIATRRSGWIRVARPPTPLAVGPGS